MEKYKLKQWYPSLPKDWEVGQVLVKYKAYSNIPNYIPEECIPIAFKIKGVSEYEVENNPEFWKKVEDKPILITEDGKELFSGDTFHCITEHYHIISGEFVSNYASKTLKYFSTKELAEKYLDENKPMYSKKEVIDFGGYILRNLKGVMPMKLLFELWLREKGN